MMPKKIKQQKKNIQTVLGVYMAAIGDAPLLDADEEIALAKRIETGDEEAKQHLIRANLALVVDIAMSYVSKSLNLTLLGLIQEGNVGLLRAVKNFDYRKGYRFSTFATICIEGGIKRGLYNERRRMPGEVSLDELLGSREERNDFLEDKRIQPLGSKMDKSIDCAVLQETLGNLEGEARQVIELAFGLVDGVAHTDKEIAEKLKKTRYRIRHIKKRALLKLREYV